MTSAYAVFEDSRRLIARARLKPHSRVVGFGNGVVYVARQNPDDDLWYLERYALIALTVVTVQSGPPDIVREWFESAMHG